MYCPCASLSPKILILFGGVLAALLAFTRVPLFTENRMEIFARCSLSPKELSSGSRVVFHARVAETEKEFGGSFSSGIYQEDIVEFKCGDKVLSHNIVDNSGQFGGVLCLKIERKPSRIVDEVWG